jgi:phospholipid transport system transporter-binding protein
MKLPPTLTLDQAGATLRALGAEGFDGPVDASQLCEFDTSALALLLQAKRQALARGQRFEVHGAPPKLRQLAQLYGVDQLLGLGPV